MSTFVFLLLLIIIINLYKFYINIPKNYFA